MRILLAAIYPFAFLLLYLIIPFDNYIRVLPNILLGILVIAFPFVVKKEDFKKLRNPSFLLFLLFFVFLFFNTTIAGRIIEDWKVISKVGIAVGLVLLYIPISDFKKIDSAIIFSSLAAIVFSIYNFVLIADATGNFALGESPQVVESLLVDRLYLGMLSLLSIMVSYRAISPQFHPNNNYYLANIFCNVVFIVLIASKIAVVILGFLILIKLFYSIKGKHRILFFIGLLTMVVIGYFLLKPKVNETEESKNNFATQIFQNSNTLEVRAVVWHCFNSVLEKEDFTLLGIGFSKTKDKLEACYAEEISDVEKREIFVTERYNTHNQFFDFYLSAGFLALLLFIIFIIASAFTLRKNYFNMAMLCILVLYCLVENVFHRQMGAYYIGFILLMLISGKIDTENNNLKITE